MSPTVFTARLEDLLGAALAVPNDLDTVKNLDDSDLLGAAGILADARRVIDAECAILAGEISHRSRRELGHTGLAQRQGYWAAAGISDSGISGFVYAARAGC